MLKQIKSNYESSYIIYGKEKFNIDIFSLKIKRIYNSKDKNNSLVIN